MKLLAVENLDVLSLGQSLSRGMARLKWTTSGSIDSATAGDDRITDRKDEPIDRKRRFDTFRRHEAIGPGLPL